MRKLILLFSILFLAQTIKAQIVFCPPGAEWHYLFTSWGLERTNEEIKYVRDSILGLETVKVLQHRKFYSNQNLGYGSRKLTLIKQKGDTVFFRSRITQHAWQILYNYAALPGQSWETKVNLIDLYAASMNPSYTSTVFVTYTITVDSVKNITLNSTTLRVLYIAGLQVIERFGCKPLFLFPFNNLNWISDDDYFDKFLCYKDDAFGQIQFTDTACYYSNPLGGNELKIKNDRLKIYPNPSSGMLTIQLEDATISNYNLKLINVLGQEEKLHELVKQNDIVTLNIQQLKKGIYFLQVFYKGKLIFTEKIIKE